MRGLTAICALLLALSGPSVAAERARPQAAEPGSLTPRAWSLGDDVPPEDCLFVFATIGDSHIEPAGPADYCYAKASHKSIAILETYVEDINAHIPPVDLVIHLGDITEFGTPVEFTLAGDILGGLDCPLHSVPGNHDNFQDDGKQAFKDFAGVDSTSYSFDYMNAHFVIVDCTLDPFVPPYVRCGPAILEWVETDLAASYPAPSFVICHYNLLERGWNAKFDTTEHYEEYEGMADLRGVLERAGNVVAVINGHVHASRAEVHNGIYYIDVGATLVGDPLIRYFYVCGDRTEATYRYISDPVLRSAAVSLCSQCICCSDRENTCRFIVGLESDKCFRMPFDIPITHTAGDDPTLPSGDHSPVRILLGHEGHCRIETDGPGQLSLCLYDVLGRSLGGHSVRVGERDVEVNLPACFPSLSALPGGVYFLYASIGGRASAAKVFLPLPDSNR